jgi:hypothetical protein
MGRVHHCPLKAIPANETDSLRSPIYIAFFVLEHPPAGYTRDAVVCVGQNLEDIVFMSEVNDAHDGVGFEWFVGPESDYHFVRWE